MTNKKRERVPPGKIETYPVLPLRDIVVFPHMIVPLFVGREKSIRALEEVMKADKLILLATQINASDDDPNPDAIFKTGTLASVLAASEAARWHREGACRGTGARPRPRLYPHRRLLRGGGRSAGRRSHRQGGGRGLGAFGDGRVRDLM